MRRISLLALPLGIALLASCSDGAPTAPAAGSPGPGRALLPVADFDLTLPDVQLRPGVEVDLHARVFEDESLNAPSCPAAKTALVLHGFAHTAATWEPFADALFARGAQDVCRVVALDLPGRGGSGVADALPFTFLTLEDYGAALTGALAGLAEVGIAPRTLIAHSQGAIVVQMVQQRLVGAGSSLRDAYDVREVVLLAPTLPGELPWGAADSGFLAGLLGGFGVPAGAVPPSHFAIPDGVWPFLFFSDLQGAPVPSAPTAAEVAARGYNAPEPLLSALQLVGAAPFAGRPSVDRGVFAGRHGSRLAVVAFEQDGLIAVAEVEALFEHLTDGKNGGKLQVVAGGRAVHDMYVSDPAELLDSAREVLP